MRATTATAKVVLTLLALTATMFVPTPTQAADLDPRLADSATHWINERGSKMTLVFDCEESQYGVCSLSGSYINNAAGTHCLGSPYPLTGVYYINTQTFSWSVAWSNAYEDCASVTGWTGYLSFTSPLQIVTKWNLAYSTGGSGRAISQGQDTFTQQDTVSTGSFLRNPPGR